MRVTAADERGNAFGVVLFQIVRTSELNKWRRGKFFRYSRELKYLIGIGNNFYARKLFLRIKITVYVRMGAQAAHDRL